MKCKYYLHPQLDENYKVKGYLKNKMDTLVSINEDDTKGHDVECYTLQDGHVEVSKGFLKLCKEITKEEYQEITKGWHTPSEYLGGN